ncbi:MAG: hypothetical protein WCE88_04805, partial [Burkholderiales bacterium]
TNTPITLFADGYVPITVTPPLMEACLPTVMQAIPTGAACITGNVQLSGVSPSDSLVARVKDSSGNVIRAASVAASATSYCVDGLLPNSLNNTIDLLNLSYDPNNGGISQAIPTTGPAGGSCSTNSCTIGPDVIWEMPS